MRSLSLGKAKRAATLGMSGLEILSMVAYPGAHVAQASGVFDDHPATGTVITTVVDQLGAPSIDSLLEPDVKRLISRKYEPEDSFERVTRPWRKQDVEDEDDGPHHDHDDEDDD